MAHKRNPVAAVSALACAKRTPGLVATILAAMEQEHERAAGAWQAEWGTHSELLTLTGSATAWTETMLGGCRSTPSGWPPTWRPRPPATGRPLTAPRSSSTAPWPRTRAP